MVEAFQGEYLNEYEGGIAGGVMAVRFVQRVRRFKMSIQPSVKLGAVRMGWVRLGCVQAGVRSGWGAFRLGCGQAGVRSGWVRSGCDAVRLRCVQVEEGKLL